MTRAVGNTSRLYGVIAPIAGQSADWTILVVDDEPGILELIRRVLKEANYTVIPSRGGDDAWGVIERGRPSVDLVLTDFVLHFLDHARQRLEFLQVRCYFLFYLRPYRACH
jgi:PleD family two-component response regulator